MTKDLDAWTPAIAKFLADNPGITIQQVMDRLVAAETRERALIDELAEANAAHDDAETRGDAALLDLRIAHEALATFNARVLGLEAELAEARRREAGIVAELDRKSKDLRAWEIDARTAQARLKELEAGTSLTQTQTDVVTKAMRESQAALANARASALEEAAKALRDSAEVFEIDAHLDDPPHGRGFDKALVYRSAALAVATLSTTPPSGRFVADGVIERVEAALKDACHGYCGYCRTVGENNAQDACPSEPSCTEREQMWLTALAALNAEKQR